MFHFLLRCIYATIGDVVENCIVEQYSVLTVSVGKDYLK